MIPEQKEIGNVMISKLPVEFVRRLHQGLVGFTGERFARSCDSEDLMLGFRLVADDGDTVCDNQDYYPTEVDPQYIRRILACLQYCQGIDTVTLEKQSKLLGLNR